MPVLLTWLYTRRNIRFLKPSWYCGPGVIKLDETFPFFKGDFILNSDDFNVKREIL